mgnify:CR=1 FL=1
MKIIKRNGAEETFRIEKIIVAITKANNAAEDAERLTPLQIDRIAQAVAIRCEEMNRSLSVEEIQDLVEDQIMAHGAFEVAKRYITYRYTRSLVRQSNTTDDRILSLIECNNEEVKQENANKNPTINAVQRDYMAGEVSKDITRRILLPRDIVEAHEAGIIHFHDADYYAQHMHNCDLVNLEDMLQNGTVISGTLIEKPHSFSTACNIATQIIAQIASNQYGGQSISLTHLAPFVDVSRRKIRESVVREIRELGAEAAEERISKIVEERLREEIKRGVQTIQYQVVTLMTTNGQAPFITVFMYLGEARNPQEKHDLAIIIEETLRQRYQGVKNEKGVWITPAFPKLIYVLEEDKGHGPGHNRRTAVGFSFCFAMMTAPVWELIEYAGFLFFGHDAQDIANGVKDSMEDMFFCLVGAMILCVLMAIHLRGRHKLFLFAPSDEFYRINFGQKKEEKTV